jgi:hypothetical protein
MLHRNHVVGECPMRPSVFAPTASVDVNEYGDPVATDRRPLYVWLAALIGSLGLLLYAGVELLQRGRPCRARGDPETGLA